MREFFSAILLTIGGIVLGIDIVFIDEIDKILGIGLKITGFVSFFMYVIINRKKFIERWKK